MTGAERSAITRALDALRDGNADEAAAFLESALHERTARCSCPVCGLRFAWPGQVSDHVANVHGEERAA